MGFWRDLRKEFLHLCSDQAANQETIKRKYLEAEKYYVAFRKIKREVASTSELSVEDDKVIQRIKQELKRNAHRALEAAKYKQLGESIT